MFGPASSVVDEHECIMHDMTETNELDLPNKWHHTHSQ